MNEKIENKLTDVPESMLITLWAKAVENEQVNPILHDSKALEIYNRVDYDFSKFKNATFSQVGCCVRASLIDKEIEKFFSKNPDAVAIQLGAGIDARYERLNPKNITHWYDLDLPEAIDFRRKVLTESERNTYISKSLFDYSWIDTVKAHKKPVIIIAEGVLMYFKQAEVKAFFDEVCRQFDEVTIVFDMLAYIAVKHSKQHDTVSKIGIEFQWSELDTKVMEQWNSKIHIENEYFMSDYDQGRYPAIARLLYKLKPFYHRLNQRVITLKIK